MSENWRRVRCGAVTQSDRAALQLAQHNGQLAQVVSIEEAQAMLLGHVLYQLLWATPPIDACFIDYVVDAFVAAQEFDRAGCREEGD